MTTLTKRIGRLSAALAVAAVMALAPSALAAESKDARDAKVREITWAQLMPEGEEEQLLKLYDEFYAELDRKWAAAAQVPMLEAGKAADIAEGSALDTMKQIGTFNVVAELDQQKIRMPGYVVPLQFDKSKEHKEFLLVPYFGACIHTPPPPPNQIVYVTAAPPAKDRGSLGARLGRGRAVD